MKGLKSGAVWPARIPRWLHPLLKAWWPSTLWSTSNPNAVHLTFDDGPDPGLTPWVLDQLRARGMTATFFVVGEQAQRHPHVLEQVREQGHTLGGHTMRHEHGWRTGKQEYVTSARQSMAMAETSGVGQEGAGEAVAWFRPPYGKFTRAQATALAPQATSVMWDVLSGDYAAKGQAGAEAVLERLKRHTRAGSIVVFHDSPKCAEVLHAVLPAYLDWLEAQGWTSVALEGAPVRR